MHGRVLEQYTAVPTRSLCSIKTAYCEDKVGIGGLRERQAAESKGDKESRYMMELTPASMATGLPRRSNSDSSPSMLLLIKDAMAGIRALMTDSRCCKSAHSNY